MHYGQKGKCFSMARLREKQGGEGRSAALPAVNNSRLVIGSCPFCARGFLGLSREWVLTFGHWELSLDWAGIFTGQSTLFTCCPEKSPLCAPGEPPQKPLLSTTAQRNMLYETKWEFRFIDPGRDILSYSYPLLPIYTLTSPIRSNKCRVFVFNEY